MSAIIAVGYRTNSERALQFRQWATKVLDTFTNQTNNYFKINAKKLAKKNNVNLWGRNILYQHIITENELDLIKNQYEKKSKTTTKNKKKTAKQKREDFNRNIDVILEAIGRSKQWIYLKGLPKIRVSLFISKLWDDVI